MQVRRDPPKPPPVTEIGISLNPDEFLALRDVAALALSTVKRERLSALQWMVCERIVKFYREEMI